MVQVTAAYTLRPDGRVDVLNSGFKGSADGRKSTAKGKARFAGAPDIGHLKVSFFWPFSADYIILDLDKARYQYALVSGRSHKYLWILSRTPSLDPVIFDALLEKAHKFGFDTSKLYRVPQNGPPY